MRPRHRLALACSLLISAATASLAQAETKSITVDFVYSYTANGYRLYRSGVQVCDVADGAIVHGATSQMVCQVDVQPGGNSFTLTAYDSEGLESPHSLPYILTWDGGGSGGGSDGGTGGGWISQLKRLLPGANRQRHQPPPAQVRERQTPSPERVRLPAPAPARQRNQ